MKYGRGRRAVGIKAQRMALGDPDESGRRRPEPVPGSDYVVRADTILMAIGQDVHTAALGEAHLPPTNGVISPSTRRR